MEQIYSTPNGQVFQDDEKNNFLLSFKSNDYPLTACALISLKIKLDAFNVEKMLLEDASVNSMEIIPLCNVDRILAITLEEMIELKDLIPGTLVMLELNSIVHQRLVRVLT